MGVTGIVPGSVIFDLDGVVYLGSTPIPGAAQAISSLIHDGWQVLFATNNSSKSPQSVADVMAERAGLSIEPDTVVTSGMAAAEHLKAEGVATALVVGSAQLRSTVRGAGISLLPAHPAESVVVGLDMAATYETIANASAAVRGGAMFVATNTDTTIPTPDGLLPGAGAIVAAIAAASGTEPIICGKPHDPMSVLIDGLLESDNVWMVGDRPDTDIAFAKAAGWQSVLALSGVTSTAESIPPRLTPDHVIDSVAELRGVLTEAIESGRDEG